MTSGCHCRVEMWTKVSPPVRDTLQGLLAGLWRISPYHVLVVADGQVHFTGVLRMEPMVSVPTDFSWEGLSCPSRGALVATKDANSSSKWGITISRPGMASAGSLPKCGLFSPQPLPISLECIFSPLELLFQHMSHQATSFFLCLP